MSVKITQFKFLHAPVNYKKHAKISENPIFIPFSTVKKHFSPLKSSKIRTFILLQEKVNPQIFWIENHWCCVTCHAMLPELIFSFIWWHDTAFKICLSTWQLLRLLMKEICIFSNVHWQIIPKANCLNNIYINFWINYCKK